LEQQWKELRQSLQDKVKHDQDRAAITVYMRKEVARTSGEK